MERGVFTPMVFSTSGGMERRRILYSSSKDGHYDQSEILGDNHLHQQETALRSSENNGHRTAVLQGQAGLIILFRVKLVLFLAHNTFSCQISFYF